MFRYYMKLGAKRVELVQLMQNFVQRSRFEIFRNKPPDPHHRTLISCFNVFRNIWVHLSMFCYYMKLGAKRVELVQLVHKFVP